MFSQKYKYTFYTLKLRDGEQVIVTILKSKVAIKQIIRPENISCNALMYRACFNSDETLDFYENINLQNT